MIRAALDYGVRSRSEVEAEHDANLEEIMSQVASERARARQLGLLVKVPERKNKQRRQTMIRAALLALLLSLAGCGYAVRFGVPENWWSDTGHGGPDAPKHQPARR